VLDSKKRILKILVIGIFILGIGSNFFIYSLIQSEIGSFAVPFGRETTEQFLQHTLSFYSAYQAINEKPTTERRYLILGEQRTYHLKVPFVCANLFAPSPVSDVCNSSEGVGEIMNHFSKENIGFIVLNESEVKRLGGLEKFGFSAKGEKLLLAFLNEYGKLILNERGIKLFEL
jgi:hypothetical protein